MLSRFTLIVACFFVLMVTGCAPGTMDGQAIPRTGNQMIIDDVRKHFPKGNECYIDRLLQGLSEAPECKAAIAAIRQLRAGMTKQEVDRQLEIARIEKIVDSHPEENIDVWHFDIPRKNDPIPIALAFYGDYLQVVMRIPIGMDA